MNNELASLVLGRYRVKPLKDKTCHFIHGLKTINHHIREATCLHLTLVVIYDRPCLLPIDFKTFTNDVFFVVIALDQRLTRLIIETRDLRR